MTKSLSLSLRGASFAALAMMATYGIVGCGGSNDNSTPTPSPTPTVTPSPTPTATPTPTPSPSPSPVVSPSPDPTPNPIVTTASGLQYQDVVVGTGLEAIGGSTATVTYVGTFTDGTQFDAGTFSFKVGTGQVIPGFDEGVNGMKIGGKRLLFIPANLAYGAAGSPPKIAPNTPLNFSIELTNVLLPAK